MVDDWRSKGVPIIPGVSVAVLLPDGTEVVVARGVADLVTEVPVTPDDYFRIGSISKTITSIALLQLVAEGLVALDEPASTYVGDLLAGYTLNGVDYGNSVTVRQLLNHTDGFAEYAYDLGFYLQTSERLDQVFEPGEIIDWAISRGPQHAPGTAYAYNTVGHNVVGLVIEAVTGQPAHEVLRERIFDPLDLKAIFLPPAEDPPQPVVHGYAATTLKAAFDLLPATAAMAPTATVGEVYDISVVPQEAIRSAGWTGGGIEAQMKDVAHIFRAMFNGSLLDEDMITEFLTTSEFSNYALGISIGEADVNTAGAAVELSEGTISYSHGGGVPGFRSHAAYYPELDIALAISTNVLPADPDVVILANGIIAAILAASDGLLDGNCESCSTPVTDSTSAASEAPAGLDLFLVRGPWEVGVRTLQLDDRAVEVWYPVEPLAVASKSTEVVNGVDLISEVLQPFIPGDLGGEVDTGAYRDAPAATSDERFPVAAYSHGSPGYRQAATFLTGHLASHGVITIAVEHLGRSLSTLLTPLAGADTAEDDVTDLLNALDLVSDDSELGAVVDTSRMVVIGHSAGARTAALATADERVVGVALLAGVSQELATSRPALMVVFENDGIVDPANIWNLHESLDDSIFVNIAGTGHAAPLDACPLIQDRGGLTELREALGEAIVRSGEDGCLPKDTDARAVQDLLRIYITGFAYEVLGLSAGPIGLTAEVADLVTGVELQGFNEPPPPQSPTANQESATTTTQAPETMIAATPSATFSQEVSGHLVETAVICGLDGLEVEYRVDGLPIDPETAGLRFTQGAQSFHRVVGAEDGGDPDYLFDGGWWVEDRTDGVSCEPYEGPNWEDFTNDSILVTEIIWANTDLRDVRCPGNEDCVVDFDYVRRTTVDGNLLEIGFDCAEAGVAEAWWVVDGVMVGNRYYHPPEFNYEDYEEWVVGPMRNLYGDTVYDYVAYVHWMDGEALVFDIGRVKIDLSLEAFIEGDNCVLLDWFAAPQTPTTQAPATTTTTTPPTTTTTTQAPATTTTTPPPALVNISGFAYSGATEASVGQTIRFTNMDGAAHTASAAGNSFDTGTLSGGQSADVVINQPGTYAYFCWFHGGMTGTITVTD